MQITQEIIKMLNMDIKPISSLGQSDMGYKINDNKCIYLINSDCKLEIESDAYILDLTNGNNVNVKVLENATLNYYVLNSNNSKRYFDVLGNVNVIQVSFRESLELLNVNLNLENASFDYKCLSILDKNNANYDIKVFHNKKYTYSNITNTCVALNGSRAVFDVSGKINKGMNNSKCSQKTRGIVMDDDSEIVANPILLIDEYDCFANHGAAIGKLNDEELFYLMSRGLNKEEALLLILSGMVNPFIEAIPNENYRKEIENEVAHLI